MTVERRVEATRVLLAASALVGAAIVALALMQLHRVYGAVLGFAVAGMLLWWWRGVFSRHRVVLWLEEKAPAMRYALVTVVDAPDNRFREVLEQRVGSARFARPIAMASLRLVGIPLLFLIVTLFVVRPIVAAVAPRVLASGSTPDDVSRPVGSAGSTRFTARVTAPSYLRIPVVTIENPSSVGALVGSGLRFTGAWVAEATMPARPTVLRLEGPRGQRLVALEPRADSTPRVILETPVRDTVLGVGRGVMVLSATARDDFGIVAGWFEIIVSSGSGESFAFRSAALGRSSAAGARAHEWRTSLPLDSLELKPGDVVHMRAVARDANPASAAETGSSETRTLRILRPDENDSLSVEPAPPPEVGRSELSQRMLIILTERLVRQQQRLSTEKVATESQSIAREQARLRKRVGEIIFTRLTGEEDSDEDVDAAMADTVSPAEALLRAASAATDAAAEVGHDHGDEGPVIGVNRPLLEAFNAMWEAERRLHVSEPRAALPHMRAALDAIQKARAAERLYLRGRAPRIVLDIARIRLSGKREGIDPSARSPRASALASALARRERFQAALELLDRDTGRPPSSAAAIDTLVVLRIDALADQPALAAALSAAIDDLRSGRDATATLLAARRALLGAPVTRAHSGWTGAW
jgi:CRP-like cAMP-binding protein